MNHIVIAALYHFFPFAHFADTRDSILREMRFHDIKGSLLITPEGINGTFAGSRKGIDAFLNYLEKEIVKDKVAPKESYCETQPFKRAKVRLKKETISIGEPAPLTRIGTYIEPKDWNKFISDPDVILIDTRNDYETKLGTFEGAIDPDIHTFKELPAYMRKYVADKKKRIASFCTGGIRCEKFTSWLIEQGYEDVYHLKGGILKYFEEVPPEESKWKGECYVFDSRIAVDHALKPSTTSTMCFSCGTTLTEEDRARPEYEYEKSCPYCTTRRHPQPLQKSA